MKYNVIDSKFNRLSSKIRPKFQNLLEILLKVTSISIYQAFMHHKYSPLITLALRGGGGISQMLTLTNRGGGVGIKWPNLG